MYCILNIFTSIFNNQVNDFNENCFFDIICATCFLLFLTQTQVFTPLTDPPLELCSLQYKYLFCQISVCPVNTGSDCCLFASDIAFLSLTIY